MKYRIGLSDDCPLDVAVVGGITLCKRSERVLPAVNGRSPRLSREGALYDLTDDELLAFEAALERVGIGGSPGGPRKLAPLALPPFEVDLGGAMLDDVLPGGAKPGEGEQHPGEEKLDPIQRQEVAMLRRQRRRLKSLLQPQAEPLAPYVFVVEDAGRPRGRGAAQPAAQAKGKHAVKAG